MSKIRAEIEILTFQNYYARKTVPTKMVQPHDDEVIYMANNGRQLPFRSFSILKRG
jgi:hypothetical protein